MPKLIGNTIVRRSVEESPVVLRAGDELPSWASGLVGDHLLDRGAESAADGPPPKGGAGSGKDAWAAYAAARGVAVAEDATRDEIVAALEDAGVPTE
jgi:hypothetical protein